MNEPQLSSEVATGFLMKAEEAAAEADAATDVFIRACWLKIAACYREMAERFHPRRTKTLNL